MTQMYYPNAILKLQRNGDGSAFILLVESGIGPDEIETLVEMFSRYTFQVDRRWKGKFIAFVAAPDGGRAANIDAPKTYPTYQF